MEKRLITEIDRYKEIMGLNSLNEKYENLPKIVDTYPNITFAKRTKDDRLPKNLLNDIQAAAKNADITVQIDWAKTGHRKVSKSGNISRHWYGLAVDISHINGKGWSGKSNAKKSGIYDGIEKFVSYLKSTGYKVNSESGSDKAVLYFGFPDHNNHLHISNKSGQPSIPVTDLDDDKNTSQNVTKGKKTIPMKKPTDVKGKSDEFKFPDSKTDTNTTTDVSSLDSKKPKTLAQKIQDLPNQFDIKPYNLSSDIDKLIDGFKM
jgi:hypothetical protein